jgi:hypothetical protein
MSMHLQKFVDRLRGYESRGAKDFIMSIQDAKDLHADITRLLIVLENLRSSTAKPVTNEALQVEIDGGRF